MIPEKPWLAFYGDVPASIDYPEVTLYEAVMKTVNNNPQAIAYEFLGFESTYGRFGKAIDQCAASLSHLGLKKGDRITISMPTSPQAIICFYAANKLGAVAGMIHPLSTASETAFYLSLSKSRFVLTLDAFYGKFKSVMNETGLEKIILAKIPDYLGWFKTIGFNLTKGRKIQKVPDDPKVVWWMDLMNASFPSATKAAMDAHELAVILYSGGTTGKPKGIMLSNFNFIAQGMMVSEWGKLSYGDSILAILPVFHGFGLGVCVNAAFMSGGKSILVPTFTPKDVAKLIKTRRPNFLIGIPTLFEALNQDPVFQKTDLGCLKAAFCGADQLPKAVKERFEAIVKQQGGDVKLLEGYGLTESVTGIMAMPLAQYREKSIGVPFPDMLAKIVKPGTCDELPTGEEGEICVHGPAVMMGYLDNPKETNKALKSHADGRNWLHTGDIGTMDEEGFFYFKLRLKRMIKSSGMNVYPAQVEDILYAHKEIKQACVIGVPDKEQVEKVKAFVVLQDDKKAGREMEKQLMDYCREHLIKWSCPRQIEFRQKLPTTLVGKVAFNTLEKEEIKRLKAKGEYAGE